MSACAGSLTERTCRFTSCVSPEQSGSQETYFSSISPARSEWIARPAGQGFMSTQRRENRWPRISCTQRTRVSGRVFPSSIARCGYANASGGTAPPGFSVYHLSDEKQSLRAPAWLATNSLQLGYRIVQLVRLEVRHGSPPFGSGRGAATGTPATHGSSLPHIPSPPGPARFHLSLPWVPAG
jgi:hypothetical protein